MIDGEAEIGGSRAEAAEQDQARGARARESQQCSAVDHEQLFARMGAAVTNKAQPIHAEKSLAFQGGAAPDCTTRRSLAGLCCASGEALMDEVAVLDESGDAHPAAP